MLELIKGNDLTDDQKAMLKFNGMSDPEWVSIHAFFFENGVPATPISGHHYPVMHPTDRYINMINNA